MYEEGAGGLKKDLGMARQLYKRACDDGFDDACSNLRRIPK
jgi:TPR repeat protein